MPNLSIVPGSPQSSTSTVNDSVVVPVGRVTAAVPVNSACVFAPHDPVVMNSALMDVAFMRTPAGLSLYSRFPVGAPPSCTTKPKLACDLGSAKLGTSAGTDKSTPPTEKTGSPWTCPPPVIFPGEVPHTLVAVLHVLASSPMRWTTTGLSGKQALMVSVPGMPLLVYVQDT